MITVLLVDDQPAIRQGLRLRLTVEPDLQVVGEAGDTMTALALIQEQHPNVVVMDVEMFPVDGILATSRIRQVAPATAVVIHTLNDDPATRARAQACGAAAFILKHEAGNGLLEAIRQAGSLQSDPRAGPM